jgi:hypothetical protein
MSLGISTNLEAVTARYVDVRLERKKDVLNIYHKAVHDTSKNPNEEKTKARNLLRSQTFMADILLNPNPRYHQGLLYEIRF